jgi:hypothetical protein
VAEDLTAALRAYRRAPPGVKRLPRGMRAVGGRRAPGESFPDPSGAKSQAAGHTLMQAFRP